MQKRWNRKESQRYKANLVDIDILSNILEKVRRRYRPELYLEGLGFRAIGRFLNCSHVAVYNWIKEFGKAAMKSGLTKQ